MGQIAVGSRKHIDNLFREYERQGSLVSLYDQENNIKLLGPIAVRATGPTTFQVIDTNKYERHQKDTRGQLRDQLLVIPNKITLKTTKRPSLHFDPIEEGDSPDRSRKVVGSAVQNIGAIWEGVDGGSVKPVDPYRNRRWPRSKPTPRSNVNPRQRSSKVRFEELSNESSVILRNKIVRFPS